MTADQLDKEINYLQEMVKALTANRKNINQMLSALSKRLEKYQAGRDALENNVLDIP